MAVTNEWVKLEIRVIASVVERFLIWVENELAGVIWLISGLLKRNIKKSLLDWKSEEETVGCLRREWIIIDLVKLRRIKYFFKNWDYSVKGSRNMQIYWLKLNYEKRLNRNPLEF